MKSLGTINLLLRNVVKWSDTLYDICEVKG